MKVHSMPCCGHLDIGNESLIIWSLFVYSYYENSQAYTKVCRAEGSRPFRVLITLLPQLFHRPSSFYCPQSACIFVFGREGMSGIYFKVNPKHHIIPCSPNTLVYTSKKEEEEVEEGKTEKEEG